VGREKPAAKKKGDKRSQTPAPSNSGERGQISRAVVRFQQEGEKKRQKGAQPKIRKTIEGETAKKKNGDWRTLLPSLNGKWYWAPFRRNEASYPKGGKGKKGCTAGQGQVRKKEKKKITRVSAHEGKEVE